MPMSEKSTGKPRMWPTPAAKERFALPGKDEIFDPQTQRFTRSNGNDFGVTLAMAVQMDEPRSAPPVSRQLTFSAEDFPVSPTASPASAAAPPTSATSGASSPDSFAKLDPAGCWRKMCRGFYQPNLDGSLDEYSETWPRAAMTRSGTAYLLPPLAPLTGEIGSGSWPTPAASLHNLSEDLDTWSERRARVKTEKVNGNGFGMPLTVAARMWPTPTSRDHKDGSAQSCANVPVNALLGRAVHQFKTPQARDWKGPQGRAYSGEAMDLPAQVGGSLNPTWVEWLMGYPSGWTDLEG